MPKAMPPWSVRSAFAEVGLWHIPAPHAERECPFPIPLPRLGSGFHKTGRVAGRLTSSLVWTVPRNRPVAGAVLRVVNLGRAADGPT